MDYLAYHFTVDPPQPGSEILAAVIAEQGFETFDHHAKGFIAYLPAVHETDVQLEGLSFDDFTFSFTVEKIKGTNWNAEWEKNFEPVLVAGLLCIRAPFHEKNEKVQHEIVIMPKMSFGTGHHQTTRLMCAELFKMDLKGKRVLDMGCGTGILAILAAKLGADDVTGIDIDEWSVENSRENCHMNGHEKIRILLGGAERLSSLGPFDVVIANINKNILKQQLPYYSERLISGGTLLLSGFFTTDIDELKEAAKSSSFGFVSSSNENEWAMMRLKRD
jgi:ribosomal protein L11 methyltransferase